MDFTGARLDERFVYRRVVWPTYEVTEEYGQITGGSLEWSASSALKLTGSLEFSGDAAPDTRDLIRVVYSFTDEHGEAGEHVVATVSAQLDNSAIKGVYRESSLMGRLVSGSIPCSSLLRFLSDDAYGYPYTVAAGTLAVEKAVEICESIGLRVNNPDPSAYALSSEHTFDAADSLLDVVNWLLDAAGYASAWTDAYGVVQMTRYVEPTERSVSWEFRDGFSSIILPEATRGSDWQSSPNVCVLAYQTERECLTATAENVDPESKASTASLGRRKVLQAMVDELAGSTTEQRLANLEAMSTRRLLDNSAEIERTEISHPWVPIMPGDAVLIDFAGTGEWKGSVANLSMDLSRGAVCRQSSRRFVRMDFKTTTKGEVIYSA